jgi:hypothetical protein
MKDGYEKLPFDEAIEYFKKKINLPTRRWTDIWEGMHSRAFVVAGAMKTELLSELRSAIDKAIEKGTSIQEFRNDFDDIVKRHGWSYRGEYGWRTGVIFNTNMTVAYAAGRYKQMTDPDILEAFPYWRYMTMDDSRVRPLHMQWHNTVLPANHEWWKTHYPPNGWGCRCEVETLTPAELEDLKESEVINTSAPRDGTYQWVNKHTGEVLEIPEGIDPGWAYNPGETAWGREWAISEIEKMQAGTWVDADPWKYTAYNRPEEVSVDVPKASLGKIAKTEKELRDMLKKAIGGDEAYFVNPAGEKILVNQAIVDHMLKDKKRWDGREAYFPFIPELIEKPYEVWVGFAKNEMTGQYGIREKYIKAIQLEKQRAIVFVAETSAGKWTGITFFRGDVKKVNAIRQGRLLWGR